MRDLLAVGLLLSLILLFLGKALIPGKVLLPLDIVTQLWSPWQQPNQPVIMHNVMLMDVVNYIYPVKEFMADTIRSGKLPLWNPYEFTGYPFTYNTQAGMFYPFSLFYYFLPMVTAVDLVIILQMCLGAVFMFVYLRHIRLGRTAAMIGASIFIFNGLMVGWLEWQAIHAAIIWLPAQLYFVERIADKLAAETTPKRFSSVLVEVIALALLFAIPWLGGHWGWTLYSSMTLFVYMVFRLGIIRDGWSLLRSRNSISVSDKIQDLRLAITTLVVSLSTGVALSLVQVLPAFIYLSQSHRQAVSISETISQGLFNRAIVFLIPNFFGNTAHDNWWGPENSNFAETVVYSSVLALFLGCIILFIRRDFHTLFFSAWGGLTLLWALGSPAYFMLYPLPVFNGIQPSRAVFLVTICLAVLAALAVDKLMQQKIDRPHLLTRAILVTAAVFLIIGIAYSLYYKDDVSRTWAYLQIYVVRFGIFFLGAAVLLVARIRSRINPHLFGRLAFAWIIVDLFLFGFNYNTVSDASDPYPETAASNFLRADPELYRIVTPARGLVFHPNTSLVLRIQNLSGYEPGVLQRISGLMELAEGENAVRFGRIILPLEAIDSPVLDMLNVKYVTTTHDYWSGTPEVGAAQDRVEQWAALPLEQTFTVEHAGLHRIDVPLQLHDSPVGTITVQILSEDGNYEFAHSEVDVAAVEDEAWHSFFFEPFPSPWGRTFRFRVAFTGSGGEIRVGTSGENETAYTAYYLPRPELVYEEGNTRIYLNEDFFPRAFIVPQAQIVSDEEEALNAVAQNLERLQEIVILELEGQPPPPTLENTAAAGTSQVNIRAYDLNQIQLTVNLENPGFLVLSDTHYPGWKATLNGQEVSIYRANSLLRALYVPAGEHDIVFSFLPPDFVIGGLVSLAALCLCLVGLVYVRIGRSNISSTLKGIPL